MTRLFQQAMNLKNHCVYRVMNQPNDPDSLVHSFRALHHVVLSLQAIRLLKENNQVPRRDHI